jgi:hypothetical protein
MEIKRTTGRMKDYSKHYTKAIGPRRKSPASTEENY